MSNDNAVPDALGSTQQLAIPAARRPAAAPAGAAARRSPWRVLAPKLELLIVPAVLVAVWAVVAASVGSEAAAGPIETVDTIAEGVRSGWLIDALAITFQGAVISFGIAAVLGLALGFALGLNRFWGAVLEAPLLWLYSIPKIVLFPIFLLLLGLTLQSRVAFSVAHGLIPLALFTMNGVRAVRPVHMKVAKVYRLSVWRTITRIIVPSALPAITVGLRYCFSLCFLGLLVAEMFASKEGAGKDLVQALSLNQTEITFAIAVTLVVVALLINGLFLQVAKTIERRREPA